MMDRLLLGLMRICLVTFIPMAFYNINASALLVIIGLACWMFRQAGKDDEIGK